MKTWIDQPYGESEITRLEQEPFLAMESLLKRIDAIDQQLREAQAEYVAQFELKRLAVAAGAETSGVLVRF